MPQDIGRMFTVKGAPQTCLSVPPKDDASCRKPKQLFPIYIEQADHYTLRTQVNELCLQALEFFYWL